MQQECGKRENNEKQQQGERQGVAAERVPAWQRFRAGTQLVFQLWALDAGRWGRLRAHPPDVPFYCIYIKLMPVALWHIDRHHRGRVFSQAPAQHGIWVAVPPLCCPLGVASKAGDCVQSPGLWWPSWSQHQFCSWSSPLFSAVLHRRDKPHVKTDSINSLVKADWNSEPHLRGAAHNLEAWGKGGWAWLEAALLSDMLWGLKRPLTKPRQSWGAP